MKSLREPADKSPIDVVDSCPECKSKQTETIDTRNGKYGRRRRRRCMKCDHRWTTLERAVKYSRGQYTDHNM